MQVVAAVPVEAEPGASLLAVGLVGAHDLYQPLEAGEECRHFRVQIEKHLVVGQRVGVLGHDHRRDRGQGIVRPAMRDEPGRGRRPEKAVELAGGVGVGGVDEEPHALAGCFRA